MKQHYSAPLRLNYSAALRRMFKGSKLVRTNGKRTEFAISPGGPISDATAQRLIEHGLCRADDPGLLPDKPQSWAFNITVISDP
jgi:hypothetical protein